MENLQQQYKQLERLNRFGMAALLLALAGIAVFYWLDPLGVFAEAAAVHGACFDTGGARLIPNKDIQPCLRTVELRNYAMLGVTLLMSPSVFLLHSVSHKQLEILQCITSNKTMH